MSVSLLLERQPYMDGVRIAADGIHPGFGIVLQSPNVGQGPVT